MPLKHRIRRYFKEYNVPDIRAMLKNNKLEPEIYSRRCENKLVLITGSTSGIGLSTAEKYAAMGADLLLINRNEEKTISLCRRLKEKHNINCDYKIADLSSMEETKKIAAELSELERQIDIIILNAGVYMTKRHITDEGLEQVFAVNYLSGFILIHGLQKKLKKQEACRIIFVSSEGHRFAVWGLRFDDLDYRKRSYSGLGAYGAAKLAQLLSVITFKELFKNTGVTTISMYPGAVKTDSGKDNSKFYKWYKSKIIERNFKLPAISAEALYYLGMNENVVQNDGKFYNLTTIEEPAPPALDKEAAEKLWEISLKKASLV